MRDIKYIEWDVARKEAERERTKYLVQLAHQTAVKTKEIIVNRIIQSVG